MSKTDELLIKEYEFFSDLWRFRKKYFVVSDTDEYWNALIRDGGELSKKYSSPLATKLISDILMECGSYIERETQL